MNFYKFHIGDYASATRHLTWDEDMAYRRLLDSYYTNESPLPAERRLIYRLTCASSNDQRAAVDAVLEEFFTLTDDGWRHFRCDAEIAEATKKGEKASYAARKMWEERRAKAGDSCVGNANASKIDANASKIDAAISQKHKKQAHQDAPDADASKNNANASKTKADASIFDATHYPLPTTQTQGKPSGAPASPTTPASGQSLSLISGTKVVPDGKPETELQTACRETWKAYAQAFAARYGTDPVRNARVNAAIKQFVQRLGFDESPKVAAFYVGNNEPFYVRKTHDVGMMLSDAEKLRTEWATNHKGSRAQAAVGGFTGLDYGKAGKL